MAKLFLLEHNLAEAEPLLLQTIRVQQRVLGLVRKETLRTQCDLADLYQKQEKLDEAAILLQKTIDAARRGSGPDYPDTLLYQRSLGLLFQQRHKLAEDRSPLPPNSRIQAVFTGNRPSLHAHRAVRSGRGLSPARKVGRGRKRSSVKLSKPGGVSNGAEHPDTLVTQHELALVYRQQEKPQRPRHSFAKPSKLAGAQAGLTMMRRSTPSTSWPRKSIASRRNWPTPRPFSARFSKTDASSGPRTI